MQRNIKDDITLHCSLATKPVQNFLKHIEELEAAGRLVTDLCVCHCKLSSHITEDTDLQFQ